MAVEGAATTRVVLVNDTSAPTLMVPSSFTKAATRPRDTIITAMLCRPLFNEGAPNVVIINTTAHFCLCTKRILNIFK